MDEIVKMLDKNLEYISHELSNDTLYIFIKSNKESIACPTCGVESTKVHSRYRKDIEKVFRIFQYKEKRLLS